MVDQKIDVVYRPWEEKSENMKYKEEKKKAEKMEGGLFDVPNEVPENQISAKESEEKSE